MDNKKIGKYIAQLRKDKNMTQEDLAQQLFIDRSIISKWERGLYIPKHDIILKLSNLFDVTVNEIYFGERQTETNKAQVNEVTINIIKDHKKLVKKITIFCISIFLILILAFFVFYFITNYNSIKVYTITGETENLSLQNGLLVVSREKSYIQLGNIKVLNEKKITNINLYYERNGEKNILYFDQEMPKLLTNDFHKNKNYSYNDLQYIKNNLFLEVTFDDNKKETTQLHVIKDFTNNLIFTKSKPGNIIPSNEQSSSNIPTYIKENFILDENDRYYLEIKRNNKIIIEEYFADAEMFSVKEMENDKTICFEYSYPSDLYYYDDVNNVSMYNMQSQKCVSGKCNLAMLEYFQAEYLSKINFEETKTS